MSSPMEYLRYNIHDLLTLKIQRNRTFFQDAFKDMRMHYYYFTDFSSRETNEVLVNIKIGEFTPNLDGCYCIDRKYYIRKDFLYYQETFRRLRYAVQIKGWETRKTTVNFYGNIFGLRSLLAPNVIINDHVVQPLLELHLNREGYCLSHSAGVSSAGKTLIVAGRGGSRKTTLAMCLIGNGMGMVGDDYILIGKQSQTLSFPTNLSVFEYRTENLGMEEMSLLDKIKVKSRFRPHLRPEATGVVKKSTSACILLLYPHSGENLKISEGSSDEAVNFLLKNNLLEMMHSPFYLGLLAYRLIYPKSRVSLHHELLEENFRKNLRDLPVLKIFVPLSLGPKHVEEITRQFEKVWR